MSDTDPGSDLRAEVAAIRHELDMLKDQQAIRALQHTYGYLMEKGLYQEVVDLFADDAEMTFFGGVFRGKESIKRVYLNRIRTNFTKGRNGPVRELLCDVLQMQDVITVADDRKTARGRFRALLMGGTHAGCQMYPSCPISNGGRPASTRTSMCARTASGNTRRWATSSPGWRSSTRAGPMRRT